MSYNPNFQSTLVQGVTFRAVLQVPFDTTNYTLTAQIRRIADNELVDTLTVRKLEPYADKWVEVTATAARTAVWPLLPLHFDIKAVNAPEVAVSQAYLVDVVERVTA